MSWNSRRVLVTGGAGFVGSHLTERLIDLGATVTIADNLQKGSLENVHTIFQGKGLTFEKEPRKGRIKAGPHQFVYVDLMDRDATMNVVEGHDTVIHLAAHIGGRGYIDTHPADVCESWVMNHNVYAAALKKGVERVHYSSTACVYPFELQDKYDDTYTLKEQDAFKDGWANCDGEYGWSKFMGEMELKAYNKQYGLKGSITRYVTAYGPRENDTHAIIALIKKAVEQWDPYPVWGTGNQDRDFTYVSDIVEGTLLATDKVTNADVFNLGTSKRYKIRDAAYMVLDEVGWKPSKGVFFDTSKPEGVRSRSLDNAHARNVLGWIPKVDLAEGLRHTVDWYKKARPRSWETLEARSA